VRLNSISFERIPSDYAILKIVEPPNDAGGDTLWASGYEAYDRLSSALQKLAEGLTATHYQVSVSSILDRYKIGSTANSHK
jgi:alpha-ketoglutarate-dependent taurine dioxygenase